MSMPDISGSDLNDLKNTGVYVGKDLKNAPSKDFSHLIHIESLSGSENSQTMRVNDKIYWREKRKGFWKKWMFLNENGLWEEIK